MHKLTVTLKQHTPLIHFQHSQEGATLRASEVKPKLDKFIISKMSDETKAQGIREGWVKEKEGRLWLDYKMRIEACGFSNNKLTEQKVIKNGIEQKDVLQRQLFATESYPSASNSIVMSNIGGRIKEEVLNFSMADNIKMIIISRSVNLEYLILQSICAFFETVSFGNRTTKGFGSFTVDKINNKTIEPALDSPYFLSFILQSNRVSIKKNQVLKDVFTLINQIWKKLKKEAHVNVNNANNVLLKVPGQRVATAERIPSALIFKPFIEYYNDKECGVIISIFYNKEVIRESTGSNSVSHYEQLLDGLIKRFDYEEMNFSKYDIDEFEFK